MFRHACELPDYGGWHEPLPVCLAFLNPLVLGQRRERDGECDGKNRVT
jgi:hypothetical protein